MKRSWVAACLLLFVPALAHGAKIVHERYTYETSAEQPLVVNIEVDAGEVQIRPGNSDRKLFVECRYVKRSYEFESEYDKDDNEVDIYFDVRSWFRQQEEAGRSSSARLFIELPRNVPIEFHCRTKAGETDIELGGLRLIGLELKVLAGESTVSFSEPNRETLEELEISTKIGELSIEKLGNANFQYAAIDGSIGELSIDLSSDIEPDFDREMDINLGIGETRLYIPEDEPVRISVSKFLFFSSVDIPHEFRRRGHYFYSKTYEEARHKLDISVSPGMGTLEIRLR